MAPEEAPQRSRGDTYPSRGPTLLDCLFYPLQTDREPRGAAQALSGGTQ